MNAAKARAKAGRARLEATPAGKTVLAGIDALGGLEKWFSAGAMAFVYDYKPVEGPRRRSRQTVDLLGARAYHTMTHPVEGTFAWDGKRCWMKLSGEYPARFWALTPYYFVGLPFVLSDPGIQLESVSDKPDDAGFPEGTQVVRATFAPGTGDAPDDFYVLYFEAKTSRLLGVRYVVSYAPFMKSGMAHTPEKLLVFEEYKDFGGLKLATKHRTYAFGGGQKGKQVTLSTVEDVVIPAAFDEKELVMPEGATVDDSLDKVSAAHK